MSELDLLAPGVWRVPTAGRDRNNAFLVEGEDGLTLVDVGWAGAPPIIRAALARLGRGAGDIARIVITHAHPDHVRGLSALRAQVTAPVLIHPADAGWLERGRVPAGSRGGLAGLLLDTLPLMRWTPVTPDGHLSDGELIEGSGGLRVIHTPGHTPGHVVLLHEPTRTLLAGDAVFHRGGAPSQGPALFAADLRARSRSLAKLPYDVTAVGFAHGSPLTSSQVAEYQAWLTSQRS